MTPKNTPQRLTALLAITLLVLAMMPTMQASPATIDTVSRHIGGGSGDGGDSDPVPTVSSLPSVYPIEDSQVAVDGSSDTFTFATGTNWLESRAVNIVLTAPDGRSMVFTRVDTEIIVSADRPSQVWRLDGTRVSGPAVWVATGDLDGAAADGTWQWTVRADPTAFYASEDEGFDGGSRPDITLSVGGKTIRAGFSGAAPAFNNPQTWNWHVTGDGQTFQDESPISNVGFNQVDQNVQPDEDPLLARYYEPQPGGEPLPGIQLPDSPLRTPPQSEPYEEPVVDVIDWLILDFDGPGVGPRVLSPLSWEVPVFHLYVNLRGYASPGDTVSLLMGAGNSVPVEVMQVVYESYHHNEVYFQFVPAQLGADYLLKIKNNQYPFDPFNEAPVVVEEDPCLQDGVWQACELVHFLLDCAEDSACIQVNPCEDSPMVCVVLFLVTRCLEDPNCLTPPDPCDLATVPGVCEPIEPCELYSIPGLCEPPPGPCEVYSIPGVCEPVEPCDLYSVPGLCEPPPGLCDHASVVCNLVAALLACLPPIQESTTMSNDCPIDLDQDPCDYIDGIQIPGVCGHPLPCTGTECLPPIDPCLIAPALACALIDNLRDCFTKSKCPIGDVEPCQEDPCIEVPDICGIVECQTQSSPQCAYWPMAQCPGMDDPLTRFIHELAKPLYPLPPEGWNLDTIFLDDLSGSQSQASSMSSGIEIARYEGILKSYGGPGDVGTFITFNNIYASGSIQVTFKYCNLSPSGTEWATVRATVDGAYGRNIGFLGPYTGPNPPHTSGYPYCIEGDKTTFGEWTMHFPEQVPMTKFLRIDFENGEGRIAIADIVVTAASGGSNGGGSSGGGSSGGGSSGGGGGAVPNRDPDQPVITYGPGYYYTNSNVKFRARGTDSDGDRLTYEFDRGDGSDTVKTGTTFKSGSQATILFKWEDAPGEYDVRVRTHDGRGGISDWSELHRVVVYAGGEDCRVQTHAEWGALQGPWSETEIQTTQDEHGTRAKWTKLGDVGWQYRYRYHPACAPNIERAAEPSFGFNFVGENFVYNERVIRFSGVMEGSTHREEAPLDHTAFMEDMWFFYVTPNVPGVVPKNANFDILVDQSPKCKGAWKPVFDEVKWGFVVLAEFVPGLGIALEVADRYCDVPVANTSLFVERHGQEGRGAMETKTKSAEKDKALGGFINVDYHDVPDEVRGDEFQVDLKGGARTVVIVHGHGMNGMAYKDHQAKYNTVSPMFQVR